MIRLFILLLASCFFLQTSVWAHDVGGDDDEEVIPFLLHLSPCYNQEDQFIEDNVILLDDLDLVVVVQNALHQSDLLLFNIDESKYFTTISINGLILSIGSSQGRLTVKAKTRDGKICLWFAVMRGTQILSDEEEALVHGINCKILYMLKRGCYPVVSITRKDFQTINNMPHPVKNILLPFVSLKRKRSCTI